ncbi:MAG: MBL fold metallo-hydrolase [Candidatus Korobacteraceae bacterium]|jgi:L-ascorbate metabolism protein UlaG (beta-lactamase superfamily)
MLGITIRRKARQFGTLVRHSALTPRTGVARKPVLARRGELGITFIGHSSFFLQIGGKNILVDPNFARWIFVLKRLRRPGLKLRELPAIDAVLVSHAHFDHLHRPSLRAIAWLTRRKTGKRPAIIVPRHVRDLVSDLGYGRIIELDWWQSLQLGSVEVTHVPARHWGARIVRDVHRGYGGYVVRSGAQSIYHAGDTAYFDGFREIGERLKPEVALLPIGAYHPDSFRRVHTSPEDAVQGFLDLGARWMVPMHYGTFRLSYEPVDEPVERLKADAKRRGIEKKICVLEEGVTKFFE